MKQFIQKLARMSQMALIVLFVHLSTSVVSQLNAQQIISGETYGIRSDNGFPFEPAWESAGVQLTDHFTGSTKQQWLVKQYGTKGYTIQSKKTEFAGFYLTNSNGNVRLEDLKNGLPQTKHLWSITRNANGKFKISSTVLNNANTDITSSDVAFTTLSMAPNRPIWTFTLVQDNWRWCKSCRSLFYNGIAGGVCSANGGGKHVFDINPSTGKITSSYNYVLSYTKPPMSEAVLATHSHQSGWAWCAKCNVLFATGGSKGVCAKDGQPHFGDWSGNYVLNHSKNLSYPTTAYPDLQSGWGWCGKCYALCSGFPGVCPAGGGHTNNGYVYGLQFNGF